MANPVKLIKNGIIDENPTFMQVIGMCPTLAVTSSAINGLGMGLAATAVLICSNIFVSLLRKIIPDTVRIPCFIVVIATFVTIIEFVLKAYVPSLYASLGLFIPLIVV
ncbi:MAG: electron transport complex subunit RsxE, partial [Anaerotignum sp.]|nr:electron transport complex subunit RsxE [Anaerotignum sp.]